MGEAIDCSTQVRWKASRSDPTPLTRPKRVIIVCALDTTAWCFLRPQIRELLDRGWEVHLTCTVGDLGPQLTALGVTVHHVPISRTYNPLRHCAALAKLYKLFRRLEPTVVHLHTPVAAAVGRVAACLAQVPERVYVVHGFQYGELTPSWKRALVLGVEKVLGLMTTELITVNHEDADTASRWGIVAPSRINCIPNGVDCDHFGKRDRDVETALRKQVDIPEGALVVGTIGRLTVEKGMLDFCDAINLLVEAFPACHYLIIGNVLQGERNPVTVDALLRRIPAAARKRVHFIDFTDKIREWLHVMDVFVLASYREGLPVSILEAMAAGTPVVCTNIRGCREAIDVATCGMLVPPRNPDALANAVAILLRDPRLRQVFAENGKKRCASHFDEKQASSAVVAVIESCWQGNV